MRNMLVSATGIKEVYPPLGRRKNKEVLHVCVGTEARRRGNLLIISVHTP